MSFPYAQPSATSLPSMLASEFAASGSGAHTGGMIVAGDCGKVGFAQYGRSGFSEFGARSLGLSLVQHVSDSSIRMSILSLNGSVSAHRQPAPNSDLSCSQAFPDEQNAVHVAFDVNALTAAIQKELAGAGGAEAWLAIVVPAKSLS